MGEARRRRLSDPTFGQSAKTDFRGLVVSPPVTISGAKMFAKSSSLDRQELRFALLFWDRLAWPASRGIHFGSNADEQFLESAGVLVRPQFFIEGDQAQALVLGQLKVFEDLERERPGAWALSQGENSLLVLDAQLETGNGASVELHRAIPIPTGDVPLAEILEFKRRRRGELLQLREKLDLLSAEIAAEGGSADALTRKVGEVDAACANLIALGREWQFPVFLSSLKATINLNIVKVSASAYGAWKAAEPYGLGAATVAAGTVGGVSLLDFKSDIGFRSPRKPRSPYRYAYSIDRELR